MLAVDHVVRDRPIGPAAKEVSKVGIDVGGYIGVVS